MEPADLAPVPEARWADLAVPDGWEPIARMCRAQRDELTRRAQDSVDVIRKEVATYRNSSVPRDDLARSVECNLEALLLGVAERRPPTVEEVDRRSVLGTRRANQDFPIDALLQAYHVGYRDLWRRFLRYADDPDVAALLPEAATTLLEWTHQVTDGIGRAHAEATRQLVAQTAGTRHRFLEMLLTGSHDSNEAATLARSLGYDPEGSFRATVVCEFAAEGTLFSRLRATLQHLEGINQAIPNGPRLVVVSQGGGHDDLEAALGERFPDAVIGVGLVRPGLGGAHLSVGDAERAADMGSSPGVVSFEQTWMWSVLARDRARLSSLLADGRRVAAEHESLAATIAAFAASGFSVTAAARELHVHPNTVTYRLDRWRELTQWNPRNFEGLVRSMAVLRLPPEPTP